MGVISEVDDFLDAKLMSIDIDNEPAEYKNIIWYLENMNFSDYTMKQIMTSIAHKNHSYTLIGELLIFAGEIDFFVVR